MKIIWTRCNMCEAAEFMQGKIQDKNPQKSNLPDANGSVIYFTDGSAVAASSKFSGPYSKTTPDICADEPEFFIGTL